MSHSLVPPALAIVFVAAAQPAAADFVSASIGSNFNGTDIPSPRYVWFNSHITSISGATAPFTLFVRNQTITFNADGTDYVIDIPDAEVRFEPGATPTTSFAIANQDWITTVPDDSDDPFMSGLGWQVPAGGLPGGINPVTWSADFAGSVAGLSLNWQWGAAVYTTFTDDMSLVGPTPIDGSSGFSQSGSPANFASFVEGGARGGGGSNFTGSNSGTGSVDDIPLIPAPGTASILAAGGILAIRRRRA